MLVALAFAVDIRIGSRGPFLFLLVGIATYVFIVTVRQGIRRGAATGAGFALILMLTYAAAAPAAEPAPPLSEPRPVPSATARASDAQTAHPTVTPGEPESAPPTVGASAPANPPRVAQAEGYFSAADRATKDRFEILSATVGFIAQKPLFGWGGGLVGRDINGHPWDYSHTILLDPLVETGIVGAIPFLALCALVGLGGFRMMTGDRGRAGVLLAIIPVIVFILLESLVSGHVAISRHFWFFMGVTSGLLSLSRIPAWPLVRNIATLTGESAVQPAKPIAGSVARLQDRHEETAGQDIVRGHQVPGQDIV